MATPTLNHPPPKHPSEHHRSPKIHLNHPINLIDTVRGQHPRPTHPSSRDKDVNLPTLIPNAVHVPPPPKIANNRKPPNLLNQCIQNVPPPPSKHQPTPLLTQPPRNGLAKHPSSPSNQHTPPTKFHAEDGSDSTHRPKPQQHQDVQPLDAA
jgi:hypothetical protein